MNLNKHRPFSMAEKTATGCCEAKSPLKSSRLVALLGDLRKDTVVGNKHDEHIPK